MKDTSKQSCNYRRVVKNIAEEIRQRHAEELRALLEKMKEQGVKVTLSSCDESDKMYVEIKTDHSDLYYSEKISHIGELLPLIEKGMGIIEDATKKGQDFRDRLESLPNSEVVALARELSKKLNNTRFLQRFTRLLENLGYGWYEYDWVVDDMSQLYTFEERDSVYKKALSLGKSLNAEDECDSQRFYIIEEQDESVHIRQSSSSATERIRELALHYKDMKEKKK